jgi:AcrR family transcriptional regulator
MSSQPAEVSSAAEAVRERIVGAAAKAFANQGFNGSSLRDIGAAAEVNFQSIRYHFGSKEQLWATVVATLSRRAQEAALHHEQAIAPLPPHEQLRAQVHALVAYIATHPELERILLREAMKNSERYRQAYAAHTKVFYELAGKFLGRLQKLGVVKPNIPLTDLVFAFRGALHYRLLAPADSEQQTGRSIADPQIIEQHAAAIAKLLLAAAT